MEWITIATPPFKEIETFDRLTSGQTPDGLTARYVGTVDGELRVIALWESKKHADEFFANVIGPRLAEVLGPDTAAAPKVVGMDVQRAYVAS